MPVEFHPRVASDRNDAVARYDELQVGLGADFRDEVHAVIGRIIGNPLQFPVIERSIRRCLVHRFPYSVLFRMVNDEAVRVLLIRHHRREPRFGLGRR